MMKKLKKTYKILLFLSIGLLVFFLFWRASGYVGITPIMAMHQLEREHLVNDTKVILSEDVPTEIGSAIYRNVLTMNDEYLYYCEMSGDHILYWGTYFGRWYPSSPLWHSPRTTPITHILGNWQAQHYDEVKYVFSFLSLSYPKMKPSSGTKLVPPLILISATKSPNGTASFVILPRPNAVHPG